MTPSNIFWELWVWLGDDVQEEDAGAFEGAGNTGPCITLRHWTSFWAYGDHYKALSSSLSWSNFCFHLEFPITSLFGCRTCLFSFPGTVLGDLPRVANRSGVLGYEAELLVVSCPGCLFLSTSPWCPGTLSGGLRGVWVWRGKKDLDWSGESRTGEREWSEKHLEGKTGRCSREPYKYFPYVWFYYFSNWEKCILLLDPGLETYWIRKTHGIFLPEMVKKLFSVPEFWTLLRRAQALSGLKGREINALRLEGW